MVVPSATSTSELFILNFIMFSILNTDDADLADNHGLFKSEYFFSQFFF
jgi:hypothetical protein